MNSKLPKRGMAAKVQKPSFGFCLRFMTRWKTSRAGPTLGLNIHGTRKLVLQRFPYVIVYREKESSVEILAVAHGHRQPGYWKDRL